MFTEMTPLCGVCVASFSGSVSRLRAFLRYASLNTAFLLSHMAQCLGLAVRLSRLGEEIGRHAVPGHTLVVCCGWPLAYGSLRTIADLAGWARVLLSEPLKAIVGNASHPFLR